MLKLAVVLTIVALCRANISGHILVDVDLNGIRIINKNGMELDIMTNKLTGMGETPMLQLEMTGTGLQTPMMILDRQVGLEGTRQSDILFKIFSKFSGSISYSECPMLLATLAKHVERGEVEPTILEALKVVCEIGDDTLMMNKIYGLEDRERMMYDTKMYDLPMSYRKLGLFGRTTPGMMLPSSYSTMNKMWDRSMLRKPYGMMDDRSLYPMSYKMMDRSMFPMSYKMMDRTMYPMSYKMMDRSMYPRSYEMMGKSMYPMSYENMKYKMYPKTFGMMDTMEMPTKSRYMDMMMNPMKMKMMRGNMMDTMMMDRMHSKMYERGIPQVPCCA